MQTISNSKWYTLHTTSNFEKKVKDYILAFKRNPTTNNTHPYLQYIGEVLMPTEQVSTVKEGKKYINNKKIYPNYLFIELDLYDEELKLRTDVFAFIKGIQGVIGFAGATQPKPLKSTEITDILENIASTQNKVKAKVSYSLNQIVKVTNGPFLGLTGAVLAVDGDKGKVSVGVQVFGRETRVDFEFWEVQA